MQLPTWNTRWYKQLNLYRENDIMTKSEAWDYAIGMLKVDGLTPTKDFQEYIEKEKRGEVTVDDIKKFLDIKYRKL